MAARVGGGLRRAAGRTCELHTAKGSKPLADHVFAIITEPPSATEAEAFERWYVDRHMPDVLAVPGMVRARRYRLAGEPVRWMTIY